MADLSQYRGLRCEEFHDSGARCERAEGHENTRDRIERLHVGVHHGQRITWHEQHDG